MLLLDLLIWCHLLQSGFLCAGTSHLTNDLHLMVKNPTVDYICEAFACLLVYLLHLTPCDIFCVFYRHVNSSEPSTDFRAFILFLTYLVSVTVMLVPVLVLVTKTL